MNSTFFSQVLILLNKQIDSFKRASKLQSAYLNKEISAYEYNKELYKCIQESQRGQFWISIIVSEEEKLTYSQFEKLFFIYKLEIYFRKLHLQIRSLQNFLLHSPELITSNEVQILVQGIYLMITALHIFDLFINIQIKDPKILLDKGKTLLKEMCTQFDIYFFVMETKKYKLF